MKLVYVIAPFYVLTTVSMNGMERVDTNPLSGFVQAIQDRDALIASRARFSCCAQSVDEDDLDLRLESAQKRCGTLFDLITQQDIQWPPAHKNHALVKADLSAKQLHTLWVKRNNTLASICTTVPTHIDTSLITEIDVSSNKLQELPLNSLIDTCPQLKKLNASNNAITYVSLLVGSTFLKQIDLSNNKIKTFDVGKLLSLYPIESINLSNNKMKSVEWDSACHELKEYPTLDLRYNRLSDDQKEHVVKKYILSRKSSIRESILGNGIIGAGAAFCIGTLAVGIPVDDIDYIEPGTKTGIVLGSGIGAAVLGAGIAHGISCVYQRSALKEIERQSRKAIIFEDEIEEI